MSDSNIPNFYFLINDLQATNQMHVNKLHELTAEVESSKQQLRQSLKRQSHLELDLTTVRKQDELSKNTIKQLRVQIVEQQESIAKLSHDVLQHEAKHQGTKELRSELKKLKKQVGHQAPHTGASNNMIYMMGPTYASDFERLQTQMRMTVEHLRVKAEENDMLQQRLDYTLQEIQAQTDTMKSFSSNRSCNQASTSVQAFRQEHVTEISDMHDPFKEVHVTDSVNQSGLIEYPIPEDEDHPINHSSLSDDPESLSQEDVSTSQTSLVDLRNFNFTRASPRYHPQYQGSTLAAKKVPFATSKGVRREELQMDKIDVCSSQTSLVDLRNINSSMKVPVMQNPTFIRRLSADFPFRCHGTALQRELQRKIQHMRDKYT